jgi:hypothetical protein
VFPPTPTPLPVAEAAPVVVNAANWRIWQFVDEGIMLWNQGQQWHLGSVVQIGLIVVIVIFFVRYTIRLGQKVTNEGEL